MKENENENSASNYICNYNDSIDSEEVLFDPEDVDRLYALFLDELENGETE